MNATFVIEDSCSHPPPHLHQHHTKTTPTTTTNAAKIQGGYKQGTDVPLLPQPSSESFKSKVVALRESLAAGELESIK